MNIVTVAPIEKGIFKDQLTYFSKNEIPPGSVVKVPVKNRNVSALVLECVPANTQKSSLKSSSFSLKKITRISCSNFFQTDFLNACQRSAEYFASSLGQVIKTTTPRSILESIEKTNWPENNKTENPKNSLASGTLIDKLAIQDSVEERISFYRSLVRETFAKNQSVLVLVPTAIDAEKIFPLLGKGIEQHTVVLHSKIPTPTILNNWQKARGASHPQLIITTPLYLSYPKQNLGAIVIEKEGDDSYLPISRPFIDPRKTAEFYAESGKQKFILGDTTLRTETIYRLEQKEILPASTIKYRLLPATKVAIFDMKINKGEEKDKEFTVINPEILTTISRNTHKRQKVFLLVGRRGLAPILVCNDCENLVACQSCQQPLTLHNQKNSTRTYHCHHCGHSDKITDRCAICGGWRLSLLGVGTETVRESLLATNPDWPVFILDSDYAPTPAKAIKIMAEYLATPGSVLIGTEMAIRYFVEPINFSAVVTIDHMFALPGYRTQENIMRLLFELKEITKEELIIQTRLIDEGVWQYFSNSNILEFYRDEIKARSESKYPPFSILIKISRQGFKDLVERDLAKLAKLLEKFEPIIYPSPDSLTNKGKYNANLLIKLEPKQWVNEELLAVLRALPPSFIINIAPADII